MLLHFTDKYHIISVYTNLETYKKWYRMRYTSHISLNTCLIKFAAKKHAFEIKPKRGITFDDRGKTIFKLMIYFVLDNVELRTSIDTNGKHCIYGATLSSISRLMSVFQLR